MAHRPPALQAADFRRVLATRPCSRTEHFALYHAGARPKHDAGDLSTPMTRAEPSAVDDHARLGLVVPKRLARRAVTRNLVKRQARAVFDACASASNPWAPGDWVVRQSRTFDRQHFPSPASSALSVVVRDELRQLLVAARTAAAA